MNRTLPDRPNLDHLKHEAKALHKAHAAGDVASCDVLRHLHRFADQDNDNILAGSVSLTDVQFALAMDYGFVSWQALRQAVANAIATVDPAQELVNQILLDAARNGASDIHLEPAAGGYRVRFRTDGVLHTIETIPLALGVAMTRQVKSLADLDTAASHTPQSGRFAFPLGSERTIEYRVATLPVVQGEKVTCRIVDPTVPQVPLEQLGYQPEQLLLLKAALAESAGMILFAGPVGAGKTVALYTALAQLDANERNIATVERPVEIAIDGINQCAVNPALGLGYAGTLASVLETDPGVLMVADLPDLETARSAFQAAQGGRLVLASVATSSVPETITYLRNLGIHPHHLSTSLALMVAQRLVRRLCPDCRLQVTVTPAELAEEGFPDVEFAGNREVYAPNGCPQCHDGYRGRIGLFEVVRMTDRIASAVLPEPNVSAIAAACQHEGFESLVQSGLKRVFDGTTSLTEVRRVTGR